jgi:hypothetical protein
MGQQSTTVAEEGSEASSARTSSGMVRLEDIVQAMREVSYPGDSWTESYVVAEKGDTGRG